MLGTITNFWHNYHELARKWDAPPLDIRTVLNQSQHAFAIVRNLTLQVNLA